MANDKQHEIILDTLMLIIVIVIVGGAIYVQGMRHP